VTDRPRFGSFELDLRSGELLQSGVRLRLQGQPFQVLRILIEHHGEIVTRDELKRSLWPADTFVDFDDGLNTAIRKIRDALGDSSESPRYIETLPRRGYRFIGALETTDEPAPVGKRRRIAVAAAAVFVIAAVALSIWIARPRSAPDPGPVRAIAVLPLENLSGDPAQEYFAAGLTDALTTELARTVGGSLRVTSRVSAEKYKHQPLSRIARDLGVDAVIEGSVVRSGNRAHITAQLISTRSDKHLWAATYERDLHDMLNLQSEIAAVVARQVRITLSTRTETRVATAIPIDPLAYDLYQRGRYLAFSNNRDQLTASIDLLEQAVRLEPNLAAAHALLGRAYITQAFFVRPQERELEAKAVNEVNKALRLDPDLADAYLARGIMLWTHRNGFPHDRAIGEIKRAAELDPNLAEAHHELAKIYLHVGLLEKAEEELHLALQLEPTNVGVLYRIAVAQLDELKPQEALHGLEGTRAFAPDLWTYQMAFALFQLGRKQEAADLIRDYLQSNARDQGGVGNAMQALLYADAGKADLAEKSIEAAIRSGKDFGHFHHAAYTIGATYALLNRPEDAVRWLRAAADDGFPCYALYARDPTLDSLRNHPRFVDLMADLTRRFQHYKAIAAGGR
jgi:TolB-like protein/DNA-binding winged helix-turn-helix (wHTH) protein